MWFHASRADGFVDTDVGFREAEVVAECEDGNFGSERKTGDLQSMRVSGSAEEFSVADEVFGDVGAFHKPVVLVEPDVGCVRDEVEGEEGKDRLAAVQELADGDRNQEGDAEAGEVDVAAGDTGHIGNKNVGSEADRNPCECEVDDSPLDDFAIVGKQCNRGESPKREEACGGIEENGDKVPADAEGAVVPVQVARAIKHVKGKVSEGEEEEGRGGAQELAVALWFENEWKGDESASGDSTFFAEEGQDEGSEGGPVEDGFAVLPPFEPEEHREEHEEENELLGERGVPDDGFMVAFIEAPEESGGNRDLETETRPASKRCNQADVNEVKQEALDVENRLAETEDRICDGGEPN